MLIRGHKALMKPDQLDAIKEDFKSSSLLDKLDKAYSQCSPSNGVQGPNIDANADFRECHRLIKSCFSALFFPFFASILPRLTLIAFCHTQPFLFETIISFARKPVSEHNLNDGYGLVAATGLLYLSLAISLTYY